VRAQIATVPSTFAFASVPGNLYFGLKTSVAYVPPSALKFKVVLCSAFASLSSLNVIVRNADLLMYSTAAAKQPDGSWVFNAWLNNNFNYGTWLYVELSNVLTQIPFTGSCAISASLLNNNVEATLPKTLTLAVTRRRLLEVMPLIFEHENGCGVSPSTCAVLLLAAIALLAAFKFMPAARVEKFVLFALQSAAIATLLVNECWVPLAALLLASIALSLLGPNSDDAGLFEKVATVFGGYSDNFRLKVLSFLAKLSVLLSTLYAETDACLLRETLLAFCAGHAAVVLGSLAFRKDCARFAIKSCCPGGNEISAISK